jgi:hypothetical protein
MRRCTFLWLTLIPSARSSAHTRRTPYLPFDAREYRRDQLGDFPVLLVGVRLGPLVEIGGLGQLGDGQKIAYFGAFALFLRLEDGFVPLPWGRPSDATKALKFFK